MTHTKIGFRQYDKPVATVVDGVAHLDGDFNVLRYPGPAACIQAAIDSVKATGGVVYIRGGDYTLETEVNFAGATKPVTVTGDGEATSITKNGATAGAKSAINVPDIGVAKVTVSSPGANRVLFTRGWETTSPTFPVADDAARTSCTVAGRLFVGTSNPTGAHIYTYLIGGGWSDITPTVGWAGNLECWSMVTDGSYIYVGTGRTASAAQVWRYEVGTATWTNISGGWGATHNQVDSLCLNGVYLFAGTYNSSGNPVVYRCTNPATAPAWADITPGWSLTVNCYSLALRGLTLYAGTGKNAGAEVWACTNPTGAFSWANVTPGWGSTHTQARSMLAAGGMLYVGTYANSSTVAAQVWVHNGLVWTNITPSWDGTASYGNRYVLSMCEHGGKVHVGTVNASGAQVWVYNGTGTDWEETGPTIPAAYNEAWCMSSDGPTLFVGGHNGSGQGWVWSYDGTQWAYAPRRGEVIGVGTAFSVQNRGSLPVRWSGRTKIEVYKSGYFAETVTIGSVDDIFVWDAAFRVPEDVQNITIERVSLHRDDSPTGSGSSIVIEDGADHITVQDCVLNGALNAFGNDIQVNARLKDTTNVSVLRNRFVGDCDMAGVSACVAMLGYVRYSTVADNHVDCSRNSGFWMHDEPSYDGMRRVGGNISVRNNTLLGNPAPAGVTYLGGIALNQGIGVNGMFTNVDIVGNSISYDSLADNNAQVNSIYVCGGFAGNSAAINVFVTVRDNRVYTQRVNGSTNSGDRAVCVDYEASYTGGPGRAGFVEIAGNQLRLDNNASMLYPVWVRYVNFGKFINNLVSGNQTSSAMGRVDFRYVVDITMTGNVVHCYNTGVKIQNAGGMVVSGNHFEAGGPSGIGLSLDTVDNSLVTSNFLYAFTGVQGLSVLNCSACVIGPNYKTQEPLGASANEANSYNVNKQIVKAWAMLKVGTGGSVTLGASYNVASASYSGTLLDVNLDRDLTGSDAGSVTVTWRSVLGSSNQGTLVGYVFSGGTVRILNSNYLGANVSWANGYWINVMVIGESV